MTMVLAAAPLRCFLGDVPQYVRGGEDGYAVPQQEKDSRCQQSQTATNFSSLPQSSGGVDGLNNHDAHIASDTTASVAAISMKYQSQKLRLLGTVVGLTRAELQSQPSTRVGESVNAPQVTPTGHTAYYDNAPVHVHLDDGTGIVAVQATWKMVSQIRVYLGMTLECIVRVPNRHHLNRQTEMDETNACKNLIAMQLVVVQDVHAETLRWLELSFRRKLLGVDGTGRPTLPLTNCTDAIDSTYSMQWGYPTRCITADDVFGVIVSACSENSSPNNSSSSSDRRRKDTADNDVDESGILLSELAQCLDMREETMEQYIQELQTTGLIYRNEHGRYIPL
jgi:hypothetical protein